MAAWLDTFGLGILKIYDTLANPRTRNPRSGRSGPRPSLEPDPRVGGRLASTTRWNTIGMDLRAYCKDCGEDTLLLGEWYMLRDEVWSAANPSRPRGDFLCIGCAESRLGRTLKPTDFTDAIVNNIAFFPKMSQRLLSRVGRRISGGLLCGDSP